MYLSHYNLKEKPFQINPDPKFLWLGNTHKEALAILRYGILDNRGFLLLVGDVGTGKTTLINGLLNSLDKNTLVATVSDPGLEKLDFYNFLANGFNMDKKFGSKGDFLVHFMHFLHKAHDDNKKVLLVIDEAQRLTHEMLEEIRLLSNIEKQDARLLNIFLVGQDELNETLADTKNRALLQRITTRYSIGPLKKNEVENYIRFRLGVAGTEKNMFSSGAISEIVAFSKCYPRMINIICDHALLTGYAKGLTKIDAKIVKECALELQPPKESWKKKREKLKKIREKSAWMVPIYIGLSAVLLTAGGYFYFSGRYTKTPATAKSVKTDRAPAMARTNKTADHEQNLPVASKAEEGSASVSRSEEKKIDDQKGSLAGKKEQRVTGPAGKPAPFPDKKLTITFSSNSNEFPDEAYKLLDRFVEAILQNPDEKIVVVVKGYTDSTGDYSYNKRLSEFRANIVKSYFVGQGVSPKRIETFGMGPENPLESNATEQGRRSNRRIEIELKKSTPK